MAELFPAYAGVIPKFKHTIIFKDAFPRLRGGDPFNFPFLPAWPDFSPPTRG